MVSRLFRKCSQWLEQCQEWRELAPWGGGLSAKLVTRHGVLPLYRKHFPDPLGERDDEDLRLELWLDEYGPQVLTDLALVRRLTDRSVDDARRRGAAVTAREVAECLVNAVAKGWLRGEPLGELELEAVVSTYLANAPSMERMLSREEFSRFQRLYDQLWQSEGEAHLLAHPYSRAMLGGDERPPLIRTQRENTWDALARSVYSRFRLAARDVAVPGVSEEIARAEVNRACGRLGLQHESALVVLYSLLRGLLLGGTTYDDHPCQTPDGDRSWESVPGPIVADEPSQARGLPVNDTLTALAEAMIRTFCTKQEQGRYLLRTEQMDRAHEHAMRRAWMECFMHDRRHHPIEAAEARRIVTRAVFKGIPSGEAHRRRAHTLGVADLVPTVVEQPLLQPSPEVLNRAYEWIAEHPEVARGLVEGNPERMEEYRRAAETLHLPDLDYMMMLVEKDVP